MLTMLMMVLLLDRAAWRPMEYSTATLRTRCTQHRCQNRKSNLNQEILHNLTCTTIRYRGCTRCHIHHQCPLVHRRTWRHHR
uniref:Putative secreted peptide n=1 Tax=Anopheles braziliensis TaxID=58242 RepID=A0A2M3ZQU9_9DIPT